MSVILLKRIVKECADFLSEWQAGFRANRGCSDNILLLRMLDDYIIGNKNHVSSLSRGVITPKNPLTPSALFLPPSGAFLTIF